MARPSGLGAIVGPDATAFRVWAPAAVRVELLVRPADGPERRLDMARESDGTAVAVLPGLAGGVRYAYLLDGAGPFPDPASRRQPDGVHGLSMTVDPSAFAWSDAAWTGVPLESLVIYELHVGTFTPAGTFEGVVERLPELRALGVTAVELMPVADFPGRRNWGYDGASLFAPARAYGSPDDLRRLVDRAHAAGLAVLLDVVYNHTGPDGSYLGAFSPQYFSDRHASPWGAGLNFDGPGSPHVREFFIENALHWVREYHVDGLRLDATHAISDDGPVPIVAELTARVKAAAGGRHLHVIAEDHRNLAVMVTPAARAGWGLDAVWADDFHHQIRRRLAGDADGYYCDYTGRVDDLVTTIRQGWFFTGQRSAHLGMARGTDPGGLTPERFVLCLQNHDQVGNRAFGERLHHQIPPAAFRAATVLLLLLPHTPLVFMGQEWAASSPFLYFTDHEPGLGRLVTEGRRREFGAFAAFADEASRARIPDPQADATFEASHLDWAEAAREPHAATRRLHEALLAFRATALVPEAAASAEAIDADTLVLVRRGTAGERVLVVVRLTGAGPVDLAGHRAVAGGGPWTTVLTSEDAAFAPDPVAPIIERSADGLRLRFGRPGAVVLRGSAPPGRSA
ncbi:MAG: malto-oligosyltrehalose trehalohydrolase [Vicinamibacterales bacterium]